MIFDIYIMPTTYILLPILMRLLININIRCFSFKISPAEYLRNCILHVVSHIFAKQITLEVRSIFRGFESKKYWALAKIIWFLQKYHFVWPENSEPGSWGLHFLLVLVLSDPISLPPPPLFFSFRGPSLANLFRKISTL